MRTYLEVRPTAAAELGKLVPVDEHSHPVELDADGVRVESVDISHVYSEDAEEWNARIVEELELYGVCVRFSPYRIPGGFAPRFEVTR